MMRRAEPWAAGKEMVYFSFFLGLRLEVWPHAFFRQLVALQT
jgi:hypothetical protein